MISLTLVLVVALIIAILSSIYAIILYKGIIKEDQGNDKMEKIALAIQKGARAFLHAEYKWLSIFVILVFVLILFGPKDSFGWRLAVPFLLGALASAIAGYFGMHTATRSAVRTTQAARESISKALNIAFKSGSVMGLTVVGLGLLGITVLLLIAVKATGSVSLPQDKLESLIRSLNYILAFSFGASSIALFARVGGGIYTKAADVGADLVGKVEAGIPEDDPRNPATIADNVGDNVGDVAGMGADLFESYVGAILATLLLGAELSLRSMNFNADPDIWNNAQSLLIYPIALASVGIIASIVGTFLVKTNNEKKLHSALFNGLLSASILVVVLMAVVTMIVKPSFIKDSETVVGPWNIYISMIIGLFLGVVIGKVTEYYTSEQKKPAQLIAEQSKTGPATNIIYGLATGMASTWLPVLLLAVGIYFCNDQAGVYGICIAAVGMLSTLGISLGVDAFGPVADNAGGLAEMAGLPKEVRERTDALDATGNTTAAIGKGFAIGSAALTALALFSTYQIAAKNTIDNFSMSLGKPEVVIGLLIGAMLPFLFSSMAMKAVGKAANSMVEEDRKSVV